MSTEQRNIMHIVNLNILLTAFTFENWFFTILLRKSFHIFEPWNVSNIWWPLWGIQWGIVLLHYRLHARNRQRMHQTEQMHEIFQLLHASSTSWRLRWKPSECLFVCSSRVYRPTREFFTHVETSPDGEGLQILTCTRHSWSLSSEGSLACHTY